MQNAGLDEVQSGIKISGRYINNLRYTDDTTFMAEREEELKNLLMKVKEENEKAGLKLNIQKTKIIESSPITSWQIDGETMETVRNFIFLGCKITADGDCSHEIKTLASWRKSYDKPRQHVKNQRHYFANKGPSSQSYGFSSSHVWMWELDNKESWVLKNWCFWTVALEKTLESPLVSREIKPVNPKGNQSWISIGRTDAEAETPILWKRSWCWGRLKAGGEGDDRGWDDWMASLTQWTWVWANSGSWWRTRKPGVLQFMRLQTVRRDWVTELNKTSRLVIGTWAALWDWTLNLWGVANTG